jgi:hypothetical protein
MLALCWPEATLQAESQRSMASLGKSGSTAPALQRGKAPSEPHGQQAARGTPRFYVSDFTEFVCQKPSVAPGQRIALAGE